MSHHKSVSHFKEVAANSEDADEWIIPDTEQWRVRSFHGDSSFESETVVCLVWDRGGEGEKILAATHGSSSLRLEENLTGDGVIKLELVLKNDAGTARTLGGQYEARKIET